VDAQFGHLPGVIRTRCGYAGGTTPNPTYRTIGDHSETVQVDFDPAEIGYEALLEVFWASHDPRYQSGSRQYMNILFYHSDEQREAANRTAEQASRGASRRVLTAIRPYEAFTLAEDYHQKYYLRSVPELLRELQGIYPDPGALRDSTAAARINGCLGGHCSRRELDQQMDQLGLSPAGQSALRGFVRGR
jgi:methionine-S-sulfoxide reductase